MFQTPISLSMTTGCVVALNVLQTSVNAVAWSSNGLVISVFSSFSANSPNGILTLKMLYVCFMGEYVPFSASVPQKSKNIALTIIYQLRGLFKKVSHILVRYVYICCFVIVFL